MANEPLNDLRLRMQHHGGRLFRNQVGSYHLADGRWLTSGLCVGSSDLIGWTPLLILPEHLGRTLAVFTAIEVKAARGRPRIEQVAFLDTVRHAGGLSGLARSEGDLDRLVGTF